jgi:hypothetical protein
VCPKGQHAGNPLSELENPGFDSSRGFFFRSALGAILGGLKKVKRSASIRSGARNRVVAGKHVLDQ